MTRFVAACALLAAVGCAHLDPMGRRGIVLECDVPEANVFVDDYYIDHALRWQKRQMPLRPGFHRIEIDADGYYPFYGEVTVGSLGFQHVTAHLRPSLD
jgi:hypothetical protein